MTTSTVGTGSAVARQACLVALTERTAGAGLDVEQRGDMLAAAWWSGERDLGVLAAAAGLGTDYQRVRDDLRARGIDHEGATYGPPPRPSYASLNADDVRALAEVADRVVGPAVLTAEPEPLAAAAWHLRIALGRLATGIDPAEPAELIAETTRDLVDHLREALVDAHTARADLHGRAQLAAQAEQEDADRVGEQAVAYGATVTLTLPVGHSVAVTVGQVPYGRPDAGFSTLASSSPLVNTTMAVDGAEHLQLRAALDTIAQVVTDRLTEEGREAG
ncbi:hypothetical protein OG618_37495 (plasmid) [Kitasatospora sp. NBC_01246]|uniref:hypothetical protein n=1 Tax=Kitasatospora sp. NBC_01246 TaxID=2903570 RepID=UPI002E36106F|nr:hypothetical protein [Kitasatospora sp. NBC_01246]